MKRLLLVTTIVVVAVAASPTARRYVVNTAQEFKQRYREHERAITAAVLN